MVSIFSIIRSSAPSRRALLISLVPSGDGVQKEFVGIFGEGHCSDAHGEANEERLHDAEPRLGIN